MAKHTLKAYIDALLSEDQILEMTEGIENLQVDYLTFDSRSVHPKTLFICKGETFKEEYLKKAADAGAVCYISAQVYDVALPCIIVKDIRRSQAVSANIWSDNAWKDINLLALTGTKGKSTTLYFIKNIVEKYCLKNGLGRFGYLSTIDTFDGVEEFESHLTTPEAVELATRFMHARDSGLWAMGMEVSSQALKYDRTYGVRFKIGCFMNFGVDHIGSEEHPTVEDYFSSKLKFFSQTDNAIVNLDSQRIEEILSAAKCCGSLVTFSPSGEKEVYGLIPDYSAKNIRKIGNEICFDVIERNAQKLDVTTAVKLTMPGLFNVENALAAFAVCRQMNIPAEDIAEGLYDAKASGRMEVFVNKSRDLIVISDYAHNELSFENVFKSIKQEYPGYRIEALFGCPGGKGFIRREDLPRVTAKYADYVYITEEDPAEDDPMEIAAVIQKNLEKGGCPSEIIIDREQAIKTAIAKAPPKTVLALLAKGREEYMHRGHDYVKIKSDSELAEELIME